MISKIFRELFSCNKIKNFHDDSALNNFSRCLFLVAAAKLMNKLFSKHEGLCLCISLLVDVDERSDHACDENANCTNTKGSHFCTCKEGYTGDGKSCQGTLLD